METIATDRKLPLAYRLLCTVMLMTALFAVLSGCAKRPLPTFESASIGSVGEIRDNTFLLTLRSDNNDKGLPLYWRQWWYTSLDVSDRDTTTIVLTGRGQWHYYLPVYSYDQKHWHQFSESEVTQPAPHLLQMQRKFTQRRVWLARYVPYTYSQLLQFLAGEPELLKNLDVLGVSPAGRSIPLITLGDKSRCTESVTIHARTHPGEVGASFVTEGILRAYFDKSFIAPPPDVCLVVVPMLNVDGVAVGNNRTTPSGLNLETQFQLTPNAPREIKLLHQAFTTAPGRVRLALNVHASSGNPDDRFFFFPHFGRRRYKGDERSLHMQQRSFIESMGWFAGKNRTMVPNWNGGAQFTTKSIPETFWWQTKRDQVTALSMEAMYGLREPSGPWVAPHDLVTFGYATLAAVYQRLSRLSPRAAWHAQRIIAKRFRANGWPHRIEQAPAIVAPKPAAWVNTPNRISDRSVIPAQLLAPSK